ncbi:transcription factor tfiiib complex subunit brf1 [Colletotrichum sojae]|uniref:Transcription factor tfiiib complex subunit brf1 n=1 Tax=Colletotrichum sojae TaxID=2175907 RepID=A0A8H6JEY2_9PEZI|nr:transcription factor tfiiib complex subunit brf1 [Colletotrichum sojae]
MSSFLTPTKKSQKPAVKNKTFQPPNRIRAIREQAERHQANKVAANAAAQAQVSRSRAPTVAVSNRPQCPNKACVKPNVVDGICQTCGRVADDSNIVAEVQFGETSSGAAMVQGSYIAADQAGVRTMGPAFRRVGGSDDREKSIREARSVMQGYAQQLNLGESTVNTAVQVFKLASQANFVQGRTLVMVAAVCLYTACRTERPCKIMLIDLADLTRINVFKLGRAFKALNKVVYVFSNGEAPVFPEDIIYRFASKLEFKHMTNRVAEDAVRLVARMKQDWIVMGRRPSGICGACLLMAARMHNFRRTVREVVYIVKVTNHTIQERLQEFNVTEASKMTVEDFLANDFGSSSHDPPSFYRNTEAWQKKQEELGKKRKRKITEEGQTPRPTKAPLPPPPDLSTAPAVEYRRDKDGYIIPPLPSKIAQDDPALRDANSTQHLETLAEEFGDPENQNDASSSQTDTDGAKGRQSKGQLPINEEWEEDEAEMEEEISEIMNDPETYEHAKAFSNAEQRARIHSIWALQQQPEKAVSMAPEVGEDEFADDPEVLNCVLAPEEVKIKELLWVNENKDWLRQNQERLFRKKLEKDKPKVTRKRKKRPRIGEGQTTPASTPGEAAVNVMKERGFSKRINYDAIRQMFEGPDSGDPGSRPESEAASRLTSKAPSVHEDQVADDESDHMGGSGDEMDGHQDDEFGGGEYDDMGDESHLYDDEDQGLAEEEDDDDDFGLGDDDD